MILLSYIKFLYVTRTVSGQLCSLAYLSVHMIKLQCQNYYSFKICLSLVGQVTLVFFQDFLGYSWTFDFSNEFFLFVCFLKIQMNFKIILIFNKLMQSLPLISFRTFSSDWLSCPFIMFYNFLHKEKKRFFFLKIFFFYSYFIYLFIYFWLCWVFGSCEGFLQLRQVGATLHRGAGTALHRGARASHHRGPSRCGAQAPNAQAQQLWLTGPGAPRHVGSSQTRAWTRVPCISRQTLNHCATREAPKKIF